MPAAQLVTRSRNLVSAQGWRQTREVYERLSMSPGPSQTCRDRARSRGYAPPLAWDEHTIDDPRATPQLGSAAPAHLDLVAVERVVATARAGLACDTSLRLTQQERVEAARELGACGSSNAEIAEAFGVSFRTVQRLRHRHDIAVGVSSRPSEELSREQVAGADPAVSARLSRAMHLQKFGRRPFRSRPGTPVRAVGA